MEVVKAVNRQRSNNGQSSESGQSSKMVKQLIVVKVVEVVKAGASKITLLRAVDSERIILII